MPDWSWLTPPIAVALAAAIGVFGAVLGAVVTGIINGRNTQRQIEAQTHIALQQLQSQERIAAAARADDRVKLLLTERRALYGEVLDQAKTTLRLATQWASWMTTLNGSLDTTFTDAQEEWRAADEEQLPEDQWTRAAKISRLMADARSTARDVRRTLSVALSGMELVAPPEVVDPASRLLGRYEYARTAEKARTELERIEAAYGEFVRACRKDLGADPDDPTKALQSV
ncbi:MAG: hypothetical protein J0I14_10800 [Propionibacteriaceae bacterium]|nr:hypothetical protein [Propionibacteriaceae bacterium]